MAVTRDSILRGRLELLQPAEGFRATSDPLLLAGFVTARPATRRRPLRSACDLGSGTGVLGLALASARASLRVSLVELQPDLAALAIENARMNGLGERVEVVQEDLRSFARGSRRGSFDLVASNPPYRELAAGPPSPRGTQARSRHELDVTLAQVAHAAVTLARPNGGRIAMVIDARRAAELWTVLAQAASPPRRVRFVHPRVDRPAMLVLVEAERGPSVELIIEPPLVLHGPDGSLTEEARRFYGEPARA
jgi:tRNA1Val (adenine37-N6)-methyltransferase